jgi:hypothetical protein
MNAAEAVLVPMNVCRSGSMTMPVNVPFVDDKTARRRVQRIALPVVSMNMIVVVAAVVVWMVVGVPIHLSPRAGRNPCAEGYQRKARRRIDQLSEPFRRRCADDPDRQAEKQGRDDVAAAGLQRRARRLCPRPAPLPRQQSDRRPMAYALSSI